MSYNRQKYRTSTFLCLRHNSYQEFLLTENPNKKSLTLKSRNVWLYLSPVTFIVNLGATITVLNFKEKQLKQKNYRTC